MDPAQQDGWASIKEWWLVLATGLAALFWGGTASELFIVVPGIILTAVGCLGLGICLAYSNQRARR